ncbi:alpha/beta fold hydrolase [Cyanobacteria bacterium FACHB-DQ100]|nr:alpha/beta fold hydrolase [Cyanobacteria bacterium FACHB-DQ100]
MNKSNRFAIALSVLSIAYLSACLLLFILQRYLIYRPSSQIAMLPSASEFKMPYREVWIPVGHDRIYGWWIPAPSNQEQFMPIANEPTRILKSSKVMLYLCGVGRNMGDHNYLARMQAFRQLGFSVLVFDYRGYGQSTGNFPTESQVYQDAEAAWDYLQQKVPANQVVIYGESLGGAIALELAIKHPDAKGLILQSSFTSIAEVTKQRGLFGLFPIDILLTERFNSLEKIRSLKVPVLFLHGTQDSVVPVRMSQMLYDTAPESKQLFLISGADHVRIYQPGNNSYLRAIKRFVDSL